MSHAPHLRPSVPSGTHPIETGRYTLFTPPLGRFCDDLKNWVNNRAAGAIVTAPPRFGKSKGIRFAVDELREELGAAFPVLTFCCQDHQYPTEARFFESLLSDLGHSLSHRGTASAKRARLAQFLVQQACVDHHQRLVLIGDEAQKLQEPHYKWLVDIYNDLDRHDIATTVVLVGQPELVHQRDAFEKAKKMQIVGRFMVHLHQFAEVNPTYADLARHYGVAVIPARVRKPRDKAKVEAGVLLVERWILARLRHQSFFSLAELNTAIAACLDQLNRRPFKTLPGCRQSQFEAVDRPALQPLPLEPYVFAEWRTARVNIDSHLEVEGHYYSVPSPLVHTALDVRLTVTTVECFHKSQRVASHVRSAERGRHTTVAAHLPSSHQRYLAWSPSRLIQWAETIGPATAAVVNTLLTRRRHPEQGYRSCLGVLRLERLYGPARVEAACRRAQAIDAIAYKSVQSILKTGLDQQPLPEPVPTVPLPIAHDHLRGTTYYQHHEGGV
jgi:transposase